MVTVCILITNSICQLFRILPTMPRFLLHILFVDCQTWLKVGSQNVYFAKIRRFYSNSLVSFQKLLAQVQTPILLKNFLFQRFCFFSLILGVCFCRQKKPVLAYSWRARDVARSQSAAAKQKRIIWILRGFMYKKSSNKLRMKALEGYSIFNKAQIWFVFPVLFTRT